MTTGKPLEQSKILSSSRDKTKKIEVFEKKVSVVFWNTSTVVISKRRQ